MAEGHRLRRLQMGEARHHRRRMRERGLGESELKPGEQRVDGIDLVADIEAEVGRDLIVPRPRRMQFAGDRPDQLGEAALDIEMDVLERAAEGEGAGLDLACDLVEAARDLARIRLGDDAGLGKHRGMGLGRHDIVTPEALVEVDGGVYLLHDRGGAQ